MALSRLPLGTSQDGGLWPHGSSFAEMQPKRPPGVPHPPAVQFLPAVKLVVPPRSGQSCGRRGGVSVQNGHRLCDPTRREKVCLLPAVAQLVGSGSRRIMLGWATAGSPQGHHPPPVWLLTGPSGETHPCRVRGESPTVPVPFGRSTSWDGLLGWSSRRGCRLRPGDTPDPGHAPRTLGGWGGGQSTGPWMALCSRAHHSAPCGPL